MSVFIVIPAYNEEKKIGQVIQNLMNLNYEIVVVDDNSHDKTYDIVKKYPVYYTKHATNLGQGGALRTGTEIAKKFGAEIIVHFDADGQHRVEDLINLVEMLKQQNYEIVIGSRFMQTKSQIPVKKQLILSLAKMFSKNLLNLNFTDPQSGLRAFNISVLPKINWQHDDFLHCTEILNLIKKNNLKYKEIPIIINYDEYSISKNVKPRMSMGLKILFNKFFN